MSGFRYQEMLPITKDDTEYRLLTSDHVTIVNFGTNKMLKVSYEGLELLSEQAFSDVSHLLRSSHLVLLKKILKDPDSSRNDKYVAFEFLKNAVIASEGEFPMCQDTGTAIILGKKGQQIWTGFCDEEALSKGVYNTYVGKNLRYSQNTPLSMYDEINTESNLPAQIELYAVQGNEYKFLFIAKGGGSANKTFLFQETKTVLEPMRFLNFMQSKMKFLGTAACPPYHMAVVVGGTSAEFNLKMVKLASTGYLDHIPTKGTQSGHGYRDLELERNLLKMSRKFRIGAQFGGKYFCHDIRVIRLPRHGASCPIGIGVSCSADRNIKGKITKDGIFLEQLEENPAKFLPKSSQIDTQGVQIDLNHSMKKILKTLNKYPVATRLSLSGKIVVARDMAHAKLKEKLESGKGLPDYLKNHVVYYAGPAKTPKGYPSGSFGPTTAGRMDSYVPIFQANGASMVMLAKGNRSSMVVDSCKRYGGFYLGSIGGTAARIGKDCIKSVEVLEYSELGMEAVFIIDVKDFPAFILIDDKGNDFFAKIL